MNIKNNQNIKDIILPLNVAWIALAISIITQNIIFLFKFDGELSFNFETPYLYLFILLAASLTSIYLFKTKFILFIKETDTKKAPMTKKLPTDEQSYLKYYPKYFFIHILLWLINDLCTVAALGVSIFSKNYSYLFITSISTLFFNLIILKPNYSKFYDLKSKYE